MRDTSALSDAERRVAYVLHEADDATVRELARLAVLLHVVHQDNMSPAARASFDEVLRGIGPDFLLTFRALREKARQVIRTRRNWRSRA